jgi:trigger factor
MKIQTKKLPKSTLELTLEVTPKEYEPFLKTSASELSKNIKMKGFRPGKAPYDIIKKKVGESEILNHALNKIVSKTFADAVIKEKLDILNQPQIEVKKIAPGNNIVYTAKVSLMPQVTVGDINSIKINKKKIEVTEKESEKLLTQLAKSRSKEKLVDRPAQDNDLVKLDYNISIAGVPQENGQQKDFAAYLGEKHMVPGFEEALVGTSKGEHKKFDVKFPDDYFQKNFAGKTCQFEVTINGIYEIETPKLDDTFAKSLGQFENLAQLKEHIKNNILQEKTVEQDKKIEQEIFEKLIQLSKIEDIPDQIIDSEVHSMVHEMEADLARRGLDIKTWLSNIKKTMEEFTKDLKPQATTRVKSALLIKKIAQQEKIEVKPEETDAEIKKLKEIYKDNPESLAQIDKPSYKHHLANIMAGQKVVNWLKEKIIK